MAVTNYRDFRQFQRTLDLRQPLSDRQRDIRRKAQRPKPSRLHGNGVVAWWQAEILLRLVEQIVSQSIPEACLRYVNQVVRAMYAKSRKYASP